MEEIKAHGFALTYAGCFIGAGFLSGQELWQFFGTFGALGVVGLILAVIIQAVLGYVIIMLARRRKTDEFDLIIAPKNSYFLRGFFGFSEVLFTFFITTVMCAGAGSLLFSAFSLNKTIGSFLFAALVALVALSGLNGVIKVFNFTVPLLLLTTVAASVFALLNYGYPSVTSIEYKPLSKFLPNFIVAAVLFSTYNVFCSLGVITPLANKIKNSNSAAIGATLSGAVLLVTALAVLFPIFSAPRFAAHDLPMLEIAKSLNVKLFYFYSALTFIGIFGTALSSTVSIQNYVSLKNDKLSGKKAVIITAISLLAAALGSFGFSTLIGILYPISGLVGLVAVVLIVKNFISRND